VELSAGLEEYQSERLEKGKKIHVQAAGWKVRSADVEGDSQLELLIPDWRGGLTIVSSDGGSHRRLRFKGLGQNANVDVTEPVRFNGELFWLVASSKHEGMGMNQSGQAVLFDANGSRIWAFKFEDADKLNTSFSVAAGQLAGDAEPEVVIGVNAFKLHRADANSWRHETQHGYLVVLDWRGYRLCQRRLSHDVQYVAVMPASDASGGGTIICIGGGEISRYHLNGNAVEPVAADSK
jgi:hypothetical protein